MTGDASFLTREERSYGRLQAKRYKERLKKDFCFMCLHRDKNRKGLFDLTQCSKGENRFHVHCEKDRQHPQFEYDPTTLDRLANERK